MKRKINLEELATVYGLEERRVKLNANKRPYAPYKKREEKK
jgi:hypothetical protein